MSLKDGVDLLRQGRLAEAGGLFRTAAEAEPANALAHHLAGFVMLQTGELEAGLASIRRAIALNPNDPAALAHLARGLAESGAGDEALQAYGQALALNPRFVDAYLGRAAVLLHMDRNDEALRDCDEAVRLAPVNPLALAARANILQGLDRLEEAMQHYDAALSLDPRLAEVWRARGQALLKIPRHELAAASFAQARALGLSDTVLHLEEGAAEWSADRPGEALACYDRALAIDPDLAAAWGNRVPALRLLERHEEALDSADRAIALDPGTAAHHGNRGIILFDLGRHEEASRDFEACLALQPDYRLMRQCYGFTRLAMGDLERGWTLFEARYGEGGLSLSGSGPPRWDGREPLAGKTILLRSEQGLGDELQFCRYAPMVKALGARVLLETQPPLVELFRTLNGVDGLSLLGEPLPEADLQCPLMSLPLLMQTRLASIPADIPYLRADPAKIDAWRRRLGPANRLRVGLVWSGGERGDPTARWVNRRRNIPLSLLAPLRGLDVDFVSLQKGDAAEQDLRDLKRRGWDGPEILEVMDGVSDFSDTAALIETLDLVISVDTSTAHLAGALGKPVWILNRYDSCWRWLAERDDSPWYPTLRLFRQSRFGEWEAVVARVRAALEGLAARTPAR